MPTDEDNGGVRFTVKELLLGLREDVKSIDSKLDQKADRGRVHDLANVVAALNLTKVERSDYVVLQGRVEKLETLRYKLLGGIAVLAVGGGAIVGHVLGAW